MIIMVRCNAFNKNGNRCTRNAVVNGFCMCHWFMYSNNKLDNYIIDNNNI